MATSDGGNTIRRNLLIVNAWMETLQEVIEDAKVDKAHKDRIYALEDAIERHIGASQEFPMAIRLGPVLGIRGLFETLAKDTADPRVVIVNDGLPEDDEEFSAKEAEVGTVAALLHRIAEAVDEVGDCLIGAAREVSLPTDVPDEIVCIGHGVSLQWASVAIGVLDRVESTLRKSEERASPANLAVARDSWVAILSFACALAQIADHDAIHAINFLGRVSDAFHAADRAGKSLSVRRNLSPWKESDPYGDALLQPLQELKSLADQATNIVIDGFVSRDEFIDRIVWREISGGRIELDEAAVRRLVSERVGDNSIPRARFTGDPSETLVAVSRQVRQEWARRA